MSEMKILFVNFTKFWGGGESWAFQVMNELKNRNYDIALLANTKSEILHKSQQAGFKSDAVKVGKFTFLNFIQLSKIKRKLIEIKPDTIVINSSLELKTIGLLIKACGCKKVIFTRGIPSRMKLNPLKRYLFSTVVTDVIVNSNYVKNSISNITKLLKNEPVIIYHGINPETNKKADYQSKNIAIVGRLSPEKGVDLAIRAMQKVLVSIPKAQLWIIGDGKEKENLIRLTSELGIQNSVKFLGFSTDVESLLVQCSMLVLPSRWEGFGLVLLEAMKLSMPCLAFDHTAANEIIVNNETGFLIPDMNTELLAEKIINLLSNPENGKLMGEKGNNLLKDKFTIEKSIDGYQNIIGRN